MAWRDREYARESDFPGTFRAGPGRGLLAGRSIVTTLIAINVAIFVLCVMTMGSTPARGEPMGSSWLFDVLALKPELVLKGQVWRLLTAQYLHWNGNHILLNMIGLYFLGKGLERAWSTREFLGVYTAAGLAGNLFYFLLAVIGWLPIEGEAAGASGSVLGLLGAAAVKFPQAEILIYFLFPIKIRTAALVFAGLYALNLYMKGANAGGDACHIAGLAFGAWWAWRGEIWFSRRGWKMPSFRSRKPYRRPGPASSAFQDKVRQRQADAVTVDRILKKVYESGIHSLTEAEKNALREATERQKAMES